MWSGAASARERGELAARLRAILPAPARRAKVRVEEVEGPRDPLAAAAGMHTRPGFVWLDGADGEHRLFSRPLARIEVRNGYATVAGPGGRARFPARGFDLLDAAAAAWGRAGWLAGYLGYELAGEAERLPFLPARAGDLPDLCLGWYDSFLLYRAGRWQRWSTNGWRAQEAWTPRPAEPATTAAGALSPGPVRSRPDRAGFMEAVARTVARIHAGEFFQTNLCRRLEAPLAPEKIWPFYLRLRAISPARYGAFLYLGRGRAVASVSPELFLRVREGRVESGPIKGTRPRGASAAEDAALLRDLAASGKDRAELAMIVDVVRNDLGRVSKAGSVVVERHAELLTLPTVHHTVSLVAGDLRAGVTPGRLLRAAFPPASISGAPKIRAMEVAAMEEGARRGPSMGGIGWISPGGDLELSVAIRTAVTAGGRVVYHAGCGITADSDPAGEWQESEHKAAAFVRALGGDVDVSVDARR